jgi:signal transduction histidine kinase
VAVAALGTGELGDQAGVRVVVDDEGEGIPAEMRRRVFTKFWKGGARGGSGLGLYIVNGLTKAHGGTVTIGDAPGGGARIAIAWPSALPVFED